MNNNRHPNASESISGVNDGSSNNNSKSSNDYCVSYFSTLFLELLEQLSYSFNECEDTAKLAHFYKSKIHSNMTYEKIFVRNWSVIFYDYYNYLTEDPMNNFATIIYTVIELFNKKSMKQIRKEKMASELSKYNHKDSSSSGSAAVASEEESYVKTLYPFFFNDEEFDAAVQELSPGSSDQFSSDSIHDLLHPSKILSNMSILEKWNDPDFDDDSRKYIVCYFLHMNGFALLSSVIPNDLIYAAQNKASVIASKFVPNAAESSSSSSVDNHLSSFSDMIMNSVANNNVEKLITDVSKSDDTKNAIKDVFNEMPSNSLKVFLKKIPQFSTSIKCLSGAGLEGGNMLVKFLEQNFESSGSQQTQEILKMVVPYVQNINPEVFDRMSELAESGTIENLLGNFDFTQIDIGSMMNSGILSNIMSSFNGGGGGGGFEQLGGIMSSLMGGGGVGSGAAVNNASADLNEVASNYIKEFEKLQQQQQQQHQNQQKTSHNKQRSNQKSQAESFQQFKNQYHRSHNNTQHHQQQQRHQKRSNAAAASAVGSLSLWTAPAPQSLD